jgi:hypothetical protein
MTKLNGLNPKRWSGATTMVEVMVVAPGHGKNRIMEEIVPANRKGIQSMLIHVCWGGLAGTQ